MWTFWGNLSYAYRNTQLSRHLPVLDARHWNLLPSWILELRVLFKPTHLKALVATMWLSSFQWKSTFLTSLQKGGTVIPRVSTDPGGRPSSASVDCRALQSSGFPVTLSTWGPHVGHLTPVPGASDFPSRSLSFSLSSFLLISIRWSLKE